MALLEGWASAPVSIPLPARASAPIARSAMTPNVKRPTLPRPPDNPLITHPLLLPKTRAIYVPYPTSPSTSVTARQTLTPQHMNRKNLNKFVAHCSKSDGPTANRTVGYERSTKTTSYSSPLLASCGSVPPTRPLSTSKIYLRDATITLRSTYGRRRRATATDRTGCLPESQSASARPGIAPLCSRRECRADHLIHRSEQGEHPARPRPLPAAGFRGTGRWECSGQSAAYHPRGEGFHAGEAHGGGSHVERHPTDRGARRALRHRGYARGCTSAAPLDGLLVEAHPLCAK